MRRLSRHDRDEGFNLVETLVVVMIFGVISTLVGASVISALQSSGRTQERVLRSGDAQEGLNALSKDLRVAIPVVAAAANDVTVRVYRSGTCQERRYFVDASKRFQVTTRSYPASSTCVGITGTPGAASTRLLTSRVLNVAATPLFRFAGLDAAGRRVDLPSPVMSPDAVRGVVAELVVEGPDGRTPIRMTTSVELRNG